MYGWQFSIWGSGRGECMGLTIRTKKECRWDLVSLGEVMVRFAPGDRRTATARSFEVCEGGGEYNVARGLKPCFGLATAVSTAFARNPVGPFSQHVTCHCARD